MDREGPGPRQIGAGAEERHAPPVLAYGFFGFGYVVTAAFVADMARSDPVLRPAQSRSYGCAPASPPRRR